MRMLYRAFPILVLVMPIILFLSAVVTSRKSPEAAAQLAIAGSIALLACVVFLRDALTQSPS